MNKRFEGKVMLITGAVIGALILALFYAGKTILLAGFQKAEDLAAREDAEALLNAVDRELANIDILAGDWAIWDDSYQFMAHRSSLHLESLFYSDCYHQSRRCAG